VDLRSRFDQSPMVWNTVRDVTISCRRKALARSGKKG
jgi:hypothetical protein